eukprot:1651936-Pyramimonas_sp.AAC.1
MRAARTNRARGGGICVQREPIGREEGAYACSTDQSGERAEVQSLWACGCFFEDSPEVPFRDGQ